MDRFKITQKYNQDSFISWDETSRVLTLADTGEVTLKMEPTSREDSEGNTILKDYKFDIFNVDTGGSFDFYKVDNKGKEIEGTRTSTSPKTSYTVKGKPGYKGNIYWVEFFKDKSKFETSKDSLDSHQLGLFIIFKRPAPIIESVTWLDPKTKLPVKEKSLGQYAILRIESKHLENETIRVSLWDYDGNLTSLVTKISGSPNLVYPHVGDKGGSGYTYTQVSREYIDPITEEKWKGTVDTMDLGFSLNHDVMKEKLNKDGSLDILVHLNPAWIQDREGKDNMNDDWVNDTWSDLKLCIKIEHPRLPNYVKKGAKDKETGERAYSGTIFGLFYGKYLNVKKDVLTEDMPLEASKTVAAIIQNDSAMEAKGTELCKFTYVSVTEQGKKPIVLFKEAAMVPTQLHSFKVLIGTKEKGSKTITIDLDDPKEKDLKKKTTVCPDVRALDRNNTHKDNTFNTEKIDAKFIKKQTDNQLMLEAYAEKPDIPTALKNAWLPNIEPIPLKVLAQTCRYQRWINIQGYPDLSYELSFKSSSEADSLYEFKSKNFVVRDYKGNMGLLSKKEKKKQKKKNRAALKKYKKKQKKKTLKDTFDYNKLQIAFEYSLADVKQTEIVIDGEHPVLNAIDTFNFITSTIRKLCFDEEVEEAEKEHNQKKVKGRKKKRNKHLKKLQKNGKKLQNEIKKKGGKFAKKVDKLAPFSIAVKPPVFAGSVAWKLENSTQKGREHELGTEFSINFKADPLFEIEGRLDLLFVATKIPYIGQAVMGLQKVADGAGMSDDVWNWFVSLFTDDEKYKIDIDVDYHLDLVTAAAYKPTWTAGKYHTIDGFNWGELEAVTEFTFGIEAMLALNIKVGDFRGEAEVGGSAKAKVVLKKENDKWLFDYQGLNVVFSANVSVRKKDDVKKSKKEEPKSGDRFLIQGPFTYEIEV